MYRRHLIRIITAGILLLMVFTSCGTFDTEGETGAGELAIALDPEVRSGVLDNGLSWYVRPNSEPEKRASLRLVVDAGSILEEDDQQGLAHFCEHMAFNGTENFEKSELVDYLESIGMAFGPEINAYTGFDETVYMLEIPTDDDEIISNAFQVLEDWAHLVSYEDEEVEKERGVIQEEWRLGRGASGRILDKMIPVLFKDSKYSERLPIGKMDVVMNAPVQRLRDYYKSWYRPELMAVIVVGDIEPEKAEKLIRQHFAFKSPVDAPARPVFSVPSSTGTDVLMIPDPELTYVTVEITAKTGPVSQRTESDYRRMLLESLSWSMFNDRLDEAAKRPEPPFIGAGGGVGRIVRTSGTVSCYASADTDSAIKALEAMVYELERASRYGFTDGEWERTKANYLKSIEEYYLERENISSSGFASELVDYYLLDVFMPGPEAEHELYNRLIPGISLAEINTYAQDMLPSGGRTLTLIYPENADAPSEESIRQLLESGKDMNVERWVDDALDRELMEGVPVKGSIISRESFDGIQAELWHLSNGADVVFKKTDFKEDEILFSAFSRGGLSLSSDEEFISGRYAPLLLTQSGLGGFNSNQLQKKLSGLSIRLSPYIGTAFEGMSGSFSPDEIKVFMQLVNMYFTEAVFSPEVHENLVVRLTSIVENRKADPMNVYYDRISELLSGGDFRSRPLDEPSIKMFTPDLSEQVYLERFGGADDFVFVFTGNINPDRLEQEVITYLASLPSGVTGESPVDLGVRPPEGVVEDIVAKGIEMQSRVHLTFHGGLDVWSSNIELQMGVTASVLETLLRENIREELSGTYHISVSADVQREPYPSYKIHIDFGCEPIRLDELTSKVFKLLSDVAGGELEGNYIIRQEEQYRRSYEKSIEKNSFWLKHLEDSFGYGDDPEDLLTPEDFNEKISRESVIAAVNEYINPDEYVKVVLVPGN
ncbi:MAG: insulinase family protein [Spirochaetales bacterium]|nr:insulinase family protein [Spirochaetales bacterium]